MIRKCDQCGNEARWMIGDMDTGDQRQLCNDCSAFVAPGDAAAPIAAAITALPEVCELCGVEPTAVVLVSADGQQRTALGSMCQLVQARMLWLDTPGEVQETIDAHVEAANTAATEGTANKRGRRRRVAVDDAGDHPEAVAPPEAEATGVSDPATGEGEDTARDAAG